jgi:hypothetical protein
MSTLPPSPSWRKNVPPDLLEALESMSMEQLNERARENGDHIASVTNEQIAIFSIIYLRTHPNDKAAT